MTCSVVQFSVTHRLVLLLPVILSPLTRMVRVANRPYVILRPVTRLQLTRPIQTTKRHDGASRFV